MSHKKFIAALIGAVLLYVQQEFGVDFGIAAENLPPWVIGLAAAIGVERLTNK